MHTGRLFALTGVIIGIIGLFMKALRTGGEGILGALHAANPDIPAAIPTIWGGMDTWAQVVLAILIIEVVGLAFRGARASMMDRKSSIITAFTGLAMLAYVLIKLFDARDQASGLQAAFAQAAGAGAIPQAYTVSAGIGFFVLGVGTVLVIAGGFGGMRKPA